MAIFVIFVLFCLVLVLTFVKIMNALAEPAALIPHIPKSDLKSMRYIKGQINKYIYINTYILFVSELILI